MKAETNYKEVFEIRKETFDEFERIFDDVERSEKYYTERIETEKTKGEECDAITLHYCEIKLKALANIKLALIELSEKI